MLSLLLRFGPSAAAAALLVASGFWIGHQGVYKERAITAEHDRQCLDDQRAVAVAAAEAYSKELEAASARAMAAEAASRASADQLNQARRSAAAKITEVRRAQPFPVACITDDLRLRVNAAVAAINSGRNPIAVDPGGMPISMPGSTGARLRPPRVDR